MRHTVDQYCYGITVSAFSQVWVGGLDVCAMGGCAGGQYVGVGGSGAVV